MALEYLQSRHPANLNSPTEEAAACHRADLVSPGLFRSVTRQVFHQQRAWSDEADVVLEHIEQLRQFIQAGAAEEASEPGQALGVDH